MRSVRRVLLVALLTLGFGISTVSAQDDVRDARQKREQVRQERASALKELQAAKLQDGELAELITVLGADIAGAQVRIGSIQQELQAKIAEVDQARAEVAEANDRAARLDEEITTVAVASFILSGQKTAAFFESGTLSEAYRQESLLRNANAEPSELLEQLRSVREDRAIAENVVAAAAAETIELERALQDALELLKQEEAASIKLRSELETRISSWQDLVNQRTKDERELTQYILENDPALAARNAPIPRPGDTSVEGFQWPVIGKVSSGFGPRRHPIFGSTRQHNGLDIGGSSGTPITSAKGGEVIFVGTRGGYGNAVIVSHGEGISTLYAHMSAIESAEGQTVSRGDVIGYVGSTGWSTAPHLHFEVRLNGRAIDPLPYMP